MAWWVLRPRPTPPLPHPEVSTEAAAESARVAIEVQDWGRALVWVDLLAAREPRNVMRLLGLGLALHNYAWSGGRFARERSAMRTSLERIRLEQRALELMDSAATLAATDEQWARIRHWRGQTYENIGLPVDALDDYAVVLERVPGYAMSVPRQLWVVHHLRDPLAGGSQP